MKRFLMIALSSLCLLSIYAQHRQVRPDWLIEIPEAGNSTYDYVVEHGVGLTEKDARDEAINYIHQYYIQALGGGIESSERGITKQSETFHIPFRKVCEYTEHQSDGTYCVYVLCQVAVKGNITPVFDDYRDCNSIDLYRDYIRKKNVTAIIASAFVPGVGQMTKRHFGEGVGTLLGEGALIGTGAAMVSLSKKQKKIMDDISGSIDYDTYMSAKNKYNAYRYTAYGLFGAAAVLYGINLWRAWSCNYRFKEMAFYPTAIPDYTAPTGFALGVGMNVNF